MKLQDRFEAEKFELSYADLHHEITKEEAHEAQKKPNSSENNVRRTPPTVVDDELVKYMSYLPSYLEKGSQSAKERAFHVGVLDWGLLQKWQQHSNKQQQIVMHKTSRYSTSTSSACSSFSTEGSSSHSSRGRSSSPAQQRLYQTHFAHSNGVSVDRKTIQLKDQKSPSIGVHHSEGEMEPSKKRAEVASCSKDKAEVQECNKRIEQLPQEKVVLLLPRAVSSDDGSEAAAASRCTDDSNGGKTKLRSAGAKPFPIIPRSCHLPREPDRLMNMKQPVLAEARKTASTRQRPPARDEIQEAKSIINVPSKNIEKGSRSTSPFRRLGKIMKSYSSSSKEQPHSMPPGPSIDPDKANAGSRPSQRSSPLRRFLDPILKPKTTDEPSKKNEKHQEEDRKTSRGRSDSLTVPAEEKVKLGPTGSRSATVQALLRVAYKNGLPLFTFAVEDDGGEIVAATVKNSSLEEKGSSCSSVYTFFAIRETKKKSSSWIMSHGSSQSKSKSKSKGRHDNYVPNVVAQMNVSDTTCSSSVDNIRLREFVMFSVDTRRPNVLDLDCHPNDELAAIVTEVPNKTSSSTKDGKTTVILPCGVHSLPSKGEPYSLVHRWKSGGSCDCGGWDPGCRFEILSGHHHNSSAAGQFSLFPRGDTQEKQQPPAFILAPFKDGIYSVEFGPSLSVLQAFSTCIAVLDSMKLVEYYFEGGGHLSEPKPCSGVEGGGDLPPKYASNPPLSPFGRV